MRFRLSALSLATVVTVVAPTGLASAQDATEEPAAAPAEEPAAPAAGSTGAGDEVDPARQVHYGVALRLRSVRAPQGLIELFVDRAAGGASNVGVGVEFIRRRGDVELQFGIERDNITPGAGVWINKGDNVAAGAEADYILSPDDAPGGTTFGWWTFEFTFLNHARINDYVAFRYGGGAGLGIFRGELWRYDVACVGATNESPEPGCVPAQLGGRGVATGPVRYDMPPVFPVVNAIVGVQIKPTKGLVINVEGGLRTLPFFGISTGYIF